MVNKVVRNVAELNFDAVKEDLIEYLKNRPEFTDYNFEGAGLNAILDVLAYNDHYTAFYANMIANEMFLDSAQIRSSIVSNAKLLGYTPNSNTAARATINLQLNNIPGTTTSVSIPRGTKFNAVNEGVTYVFYTIEEYFATSTGGFLVENVQMVEGKEFNFRYTVDNSAEQRYEIPNDNIDISLIQVEVLLSAGDTEGQIYTRVDNVSDIDGDSFVYFIEENSDGKYEILFGDNVFGNRPEDNNVIDIRYNINNGSAANFIPTFTLSGSIQGFSDVTITTVEASNSGSERQTKESVRTLAPKAIQTQNRAITAEDYRTLLLRDYPNIIDAKVWGGEEAVPPQFGKVFIALLPKENFIITDSIKEFILDSVIKPFNIATVIPEIVDTQYMDILVDSTVFYERNNTTLTANQLADVVRQEILDFSDDFLSRFDKTFHYSNFICLIDETENSIVSNETNIKARITVDSFINTNFRYDIQFNNPITPGSVISSGITLSDGNEYFIDDDSNGVLRLFRVSSGQNIYTINNFGTVDYTTGQVIIDCLNVFTGDTFSVTMTPSKRNLESLREQILRIQEENITITIEEN